MGTRERVTEANARGDSDAASAQACRGSVTCRLLCLAISGVLVTQRVGPFTLRREYRCLTSLEYLELAIELRTRGVDWS